MVLTKVLLVTDARAKFAACAKKFSRLKKFQKLEYNGLGIKVPLRFKFAIQRRPDTIPTTSLITHYNVR
jgi:hypothetical protein